MRNKKRVFIIAGFCLLLLLTGTINILLNNTLAEDINTGNIVTAGNFFTNYRSDRTVTRNQELMILNAIITSTASSAEVKANAEAERIKLKDKMERELIIEGAIKAKGFSDVIISDLNNSISIIVKSAQLTASEVAQIVEIVQSQTEYEDIDNIKIIPVE